MPCVYVYNKIDQISLEEVDRYLPSIVQALQFVLFIVLAFMKIYLCNLLACLKLLCSQKKNCKLHRSA
jgi:hypothetical protein